MRLVRFVKHHGPWNAGETAGFSDEEAARLVAVKAAVIEEVAPATPASAPPAEATDAEPEAVVQPAETAGFSDEEAAADLENDSAPEQPSASDANAKLTRAQRKALRRAAADQ